MSLTGGVYYFANADAAFAAAYNGGTATTDGCIYHKYETSSGANFSGLISPTLYADKSTYDISGNYSFGWSIVYNDNSESYNGIWYYGGKTGIIDDINICFVAPTIALTSESGFVPTGGTTFPLYITNIYYPSSATTPFTSPFSNIPQSFQVANPNRDPSVGTNFPYWVNVGTNWVVRGKLNSTVNSPDIGDIIANGTNVDDSIPDGDYSVASVYALSAQASSGAPCFLEGSQILCLVDEKETYLPIEKMRKGTLVKTLNSGYKMVHIIGKRDIPNFNDSNRIKDRLYKLTSAQYPALTSDLYLTGCHSTLVDSLTEEQKEEIKKMLGVVCITEGKYRLPASVDQKAEPWQSAGTYTVWHFALDDQDPLINFGVYANGGLVVETGSIRYLQGKANMELV